MTWRMKLFLMVMALIVAVMAACSVQENEVVQDKGDEPAIMEKIECSPSQETEGLEMALTAAPIFGSQMIVQRDQPLIIWGTATPCSLVMVAIGDQETQTQVNASGKWQVQLQPLPAGGPYTMSIAGATEHRVVFDGISSGDIWLFTGQSNMNVMFGGEIAPEQEMPYADDIRSYRVALPNDVFNPENTPENEWVQLSDSMSQYFSKVAYYTLKNIYEREQVPQGMIVVTAGDARAETFIDPEVMRRYPELGQLLRGPANVPQHKQGLIYKHSLQPLVPFAIKGVVWYQGESNNQRGNGPGSYAVYKQLLEAYFTNLREDFGNERLPIVTVQLPNYINPWNSFPTVRQAQLEMLQASPHNGMVVTIDVGDPNDIHPRDKQTVGDRLGRWILNKVYGHEDIVPSGPIIQKAVAKGNEVELHFETFGSGLKVNGERLLGFELSDQESPDLFFKAQGELSNGTIKLSSDKVISPVAVRYAWSDDPAVSLYNKHALPASPFWITLEGE